MRSPFRSAPSPGTLGSTSEDCKDKGFRGRAALQEAVVSPQAQQLLIRSDARPRINVKGIIYESVVWRTNVFKVVRSWCYTWGET